MVLFMVIGAVMILLALAWVIVPLLRNATDAAEIVDPALVVLADQLRELEADHGAGTVSDADYQRTRLELEQQALQSEQRARARSQASMRVNWSAALTTAVALPLLTALVYVAVGEPGAITGRAGSMASTEALAHPAGDDETVRRLSERLARDGNDVEGWVLLARSQFQLGQLDEALHAYRRATDLDPDSPDLWVEYANALAVSRDRDLSGEPQQMVARALQLDPENRTALAFAGMAAFQQGDQEQGLKHWRRLESLLPEGSDDRARITDLIARATGEEPPTAATAAAGTPQAGRDIRGTVTISGALADRVAPTDTLFVFARAADGPPMPLAAMRSRASDWPVRFTLDDSSAMAEGLRLSGFEDVTVIARVSRLGSTTAEPGDIEGRVEGVAVGSRDVQIVLNRVIER